MARRKVAWLAPLVVLSLAGSPAWAQDSATAQVLFEQGRALMTEGKFAEACEKFAESERLGPSSGTMLNLGECYAKLGKTASAWAAFKEAMPLAHAANQADREKYARDHVAQLEAGLVKLTINATTVASTPGLVVKRDGAPLGKAAWGIAIPVDPGPHVIEASAPKKQAWKTTVEIGTEPNKEVVIPALADGALADEAPAAASSPSVLNQRTIGLGVAAVGVVVVTVGTIFGIAALTTNDDAKDHCKGTASCDAEGIALKDSARGKATASTVLFLLGAAAIGAGAILFFTAPGDPGKPKVVSRVGLSPAIAPGTGGLLLTGAW